MIPSPENIIALYVFSHPSGFKYFNFLILVDTEFTPKSDDEHAWETQGYDWVDFGDWPTPLHFGVENLLSDPASNKIISELVDKFSVDTPR